MLEGNKFYRANLNASPLSGEVNYADGGGSLTVGSSYAPKVYGKSYGSFYNQPSGKGYVKPYSLYSNMDVPSNNPYQTVDNYQFALGSVGQTPPQRKGSGLGNALMTVLDVMQRPQYMVTNILDEVTDDKKSSFGDVLRASFDGFTGKRKSSITDTFDNLGWENDDSKKWYQGGNLLRNVAGFAGDVLLDPTTYLTGGTASLSKGTGKGVANSTLRNSLTDILTKTGSEAMTKHSDDIVRGVVNFVADKTDDLVTNVANKKAAEAFVTGALAKQGKNSDLISRIAYALGQSTDNASSVVLNKNKELVKSLLDDGIGVLNRDVVTNSMSTPLKQQLSNIMSTVYPEAQTAFNRSTSQAINKKLGTEFAFDTSKKGAKGLMAGIDSTDTVSKIVDVLKASKSSVVDYTTKESIVKNLYSRIGEAIDPADLPMLAGKEFDILDTLSNAFNVTTKAEADQLVKSARSIAHMRKGSINKLATAVGEFDEVRGAIKRIEDGIEFSNGLQRVFDKADKAFYLKYHNPFTGTVKPLVELTNVAHSEKAKAAWNALIELNPLSPVIDKLTTGIANKFSTEYISKGINRLADGVVDPARREAAQSFAKNVTQFLRNENAIPRRSLDALRIFKSVPEFFDDEGLRKAASIYIERNNSSIAKAGWLYLSGGIVDEADDALMSAYTKILNTPVVKETLDNIKFAPEKLELIQKIGQQNTIFNLAIAQFDGANKIDFRDNIFNYIKIAEDELDIKDYISRASSGRIDQASLEGYARIYDNTDHAYKNPVATPSKTKSVLGTETSSKLGSTVDSRAYATSGTTGAFMHRSNRSALDALVNNPTHTIDFDIATRVARRTMESERVALNKRFVSSVNDFIDNVNGFDTLVSIKDFDGAVKVPLMDGKLTYYAHPEVANQFNRVASVFDNASVAESAVNEVFANVSNALKGLQTKYNPSFVLRNAIGEPMMNWIAGVSPKAHLDAADILKEVDAEGLFKIGDTTFSLDKAGTTKKLFREFEAEVQPGIRKNVLEYTNEVGTKEVADAIDIHAQRRKIIEASGVNPKTYMIGNREMTAMEIMQEFYNAGLGWSGVTKGNQAKNMRGLLEQEMLNVTSNNGIGGALKTINEKIGAPGDYIETWTRLSHYIDSLQKGMDMQSAALEVRKFHVDYKDLTQFERKYLRNIMPYYTYMRKNVPMQMRLLIERQNKVNILGQLVDSMYEAVERDNGGKPLDVPDYLKEGLAIPVGVDEDGKVTYLNWGLPIADVARFKYDIKELLTENFFSMWSPMVKAPLEYTMNKNMMYGTNIESYDGQTMDLLPGVEGSPQVSSLTDQLIQSLGIVNTARNAVAHGVTTQQQTGAGGLSAGLSKLLTGSILPTKSQDQVALQQAYDYRDQLYAHIQQLRAKGVNVPRYTPDMQYGTPVLNPWAASDRITQRTKTGYLGAANAQLYPGLLKILTGQGR